VSSSNPASDWERVRVLRDALRRLDQSDRLLLAMFYLEGFSVAEIAHTTPCDPPIPHRPNPRNNVRGIAGLRES